MPISRGHPCAKRREWQKKAPAAGLRPFLLGCLALGLAWAAQAGFVAFNDFAPGYGTSSNASIYGTLGAASSGPLLNVADGSPVSAMVTVTNNAVTFATLANVPDYGTPAFIVFDGYVDFGGTNNPSIELAGAVAEFTYTFTGLDPAAEYNFQGTAIRGQATYTNRWTLIEIVGARHLVSRHSAGALTNGLATNQVAINTGFNIAGDLAWWEQIQPAADGTFSVHSRQYLGPVPGGSSGGSKGYGMTGFRLEQNPVYTGRTNVPPRLPNPTPNTINGVQTVFLIVMENQDWSAIKGSPLCPYINNVLLPQASWCEQYYNPRALHPSEPNYLWLMAGTNFGVRDDNPPSANHQSSTNTFFIQLDQAGLSWKTYQENIPGDTVPNTNNYPYAVRHNPFVFFDYVTTNLAYCTNHVRPYGELAGDLANNTVARFNFITPNLTNDMHDLMAGCSTCTRLGQGDAWLSQELPRILASPAFANGGALFLTFDEGASSTSDGPIALILLSPRAKGAAYSNSIRYDHSSLLRTLQNIFGVRPYLGGALYATDLNDLFKTIQIVSLGWSSGSVSLLATNVIPGKTNYLQTANDPAAVNWTTIQTNRAISTSQPFLDANAPAGQKFYRVMEAP